MEWGCETTSMSAWSDADHEVIWRRSRGKVTQTASQSDANQKCFRGGQASIFYKQLVYNKLQKSLIFRVFPAAGKLIWKEGSIDPLKFEVFLTKYTMSMRNSIIGSNKHSNLASPFRSKSEIGSWTCSLHKKSIKSSHKTANISNNRRLFERNFVTL